MTIAANKAYFYAKKIRKLEGLWDAQNIVTRELEAAKTTADVFQAHYDLDAIQEQIDMVRIELKAMRS